MRFDRCLGRRSKLQTPWRARQSARSPSQGPLLTSAWPSISSMPGNLLTLTAGLHHNLKDKSNTWMTMHIVKIQEKCYLWLCCLKRKKNLASLVLTFMTLILWWVARNAQYLSGFDKRQISPWIMWLFMFFFLGCSFLLLFLISTQV